MNRIMRVTLRLTYDEHERLKRAAEADGISVAEVVRSRAIGGRQTDSQKALAEVRRLKEAVLILVRGEYGDDEVERAVLQVDAMPDKQVLENAKARAAKGAN